MNQSSVRFKEIRKKNKLTQVQIADLLGVSQGTITDIERGKIGVSKSVAEKLSKTLGINTGWILAGEGNSYNSEIQGKNTGINTGLGNISSDDFQDKMVSIAIEASKEKYKRLEYYRLLMDELEHDSPDLLNLVKSPIKILTDIERLKAVMVNNGQLIDNYEVSKFDTYEQYKENFLNHIKKLEPFQKELLNLQIAISEYLVVVLNNKTKELANEQAIKNS